MKEKLLELLTCPRCKNKLMLKNEEIEEGEIKSGLLVCSECKRTYTVKNYVPIFVLSDEYVDTFSFEWNKFYDVQIDILNNNVESEKTFQWKTGWSPKEINGKLILDVGIGAGRFADVATRWGGEVVGADLSLAVDAANKNIGKRDNINIIQADLFKLPLTKRTV
jgi:uncharacterized protein YbaR (Trm112 family)